MLYIKIFVVLLLLGSGFNVLAQSADDPGTVVVPPAKERATSTESVPALATTTAVVATTTPRATPTPPSPTPSTPVAPVVVVATSAPETSEEDSFPNLFVIGGVILTALGLGALVIKVKTEKQDKKKDRCGSIRELLEQNKRELEKMVRNWPQDKLKEVVESKITEEMDKSAHLREVLELKKKYDSLKSNIELLQKKFDLCMLEVGEITKMKTLKFKPHLVSPILSGEKTSTWRLFDDKDLKEGDEFIMLNSESGEEFTKGKITKVKEKKLGELEYSDFEGHEKYKDQSDMLNHYKGYYGDKVSLDSIVKMVDYTLV